MRTVDATDRRNKLIVATKAGRGLCAQARKRIAAVSARYTATFKPQAVGQMRKMLSQMVFPESDEAGS